MRLLATLSVLCSLFAIASPRLAGQRGGAAGVPTFKVDPSWPQEMPNHWIMGAVTGVFVDATQHVWVTHLPETLTEEELYEEQKPPMGTCCKAAPPVLEFDAQGKLDKWFETVCLLEQPYIRDADQTIEQLRATLAGKLGENIEIKRFARFEVGEE